MLRYSSFEADLLCTESAKLRRFNQTPWAKSMQVLHLIRHISDSACAQNGAACRQKNSGDTCRRCPRINSIWIGRHARTVHHGASCSTAVPQSFCQQAGIRHIFGRYVTWLECESEQSVALHCWLIWYACRYIAASCHAGCSRCSIGSCAPHPSSKRARHQRGCITGSCHPL